MWLLGATPSAQCAPVQPPPQGRAAKLMRADEPACCKRRNLALIRIYISAMDMRSVVVLALCGVCSAYQATTARTGALANQVTMMAKSKARAPAAAHTRSAEPRFASHKLCSTPPHQAKAQAVYRCNSHVPARHARAARARPPRTPRRAPRAHTHATYFHFYEPWN